MNMHPQGPHPAYRVHGVNSKLSNVHFFSLYLKDFTKTREEKMALWGIFEKSSTEEMLPSMSNIMKIVNNFSWVLVTAILFKHC